MTEFQDNSRSSSADLQLGPSDLRNFGLFGAMPHPVLQHLSESLQVSEVMPGTYIFREDDEADCMYFVLQGDVEVLKKAKSGAEARVAVLGPGDWFGEMAVIDVQRRSASVITVSPARLITITAKDLDQLYRFDVKAYAIFVLNIARELSRRLRVADGILADLIANVVHDYGHAQKSVPPTS
jgi:CRP-like cAMP-binding protein